MKKGTIVRSTGSQYTVKQEDGQLVECKVRGKFRIKGIRTTNPVAVGDLVYFEKQEKEDLGVIKKIEDRENYIIRKSPNLSKQSQIIATNIDQAILITTLINPELRIEFIDRFLVTAQAYQIPAIIVFNKIDIYTPKVKEEMQNLISIYEKIGYKCLQVSATEKTNIGELKRLLKNKISLVSGNSGVGKSTLINTIEPDLDLITDEISEHHKLGKHTTTFAEMFPLTKGGSVIDTPGIKSFGLIHLEKDELYHFFPEIFAASKDCQYNNCSHSHEPECAVKTKMLDGEIAESRYMSYLSMYLGEDDKYRVGY